MFTCSSHAHFCAIYQTWKKASKAPSPVSFQPCSQCRQHLQLFFFANSFIWFCYLQEQALSEWCKLLLHIPAFGKSNVPQDELAQHLAVRPPSRIQLPEYYFLRLGTSPHFCRGFLLCRNTVSFISEKKKPKPVKSPPCSSLPCRGTRCEMQPSLETGHCIVCSTYSKLEMAGVFSLFYLEQLWF